MPHFLILDEMNLSHVERYFADLLSAIESGEEIPLYEGSERKADGKVVPRRLRLPDNLFIIGTVNVDETTYMFSPKVLDRANVIEFRMEPSEMAAFLRLRRHPGWRSWMARARPSARTLLRRQQTRRASVPHRSRPITRRKCCSSSICCASTTRSSAIERDTRRRVSSISTSCSAAIPTTTADWFNGAMDAVIVQKFLPKLHGSRSKLEGLLWALAWACGAERDRRDGKDFAKQLDEAGKAEDEGRYGPEVVWSALKAKNADDPAKAARYPLSFDKVMRMWRKLVRDQFVSFAEA